MGIEGIINIVIVAIPLSLGFVIGSWRERLHLRSLEERELAQANVLVTNLRTVTRPETVKASTIVMGEAVIATDYFKTFAATLKSLVGGELKTYNTLMVRARREARLRMIEQARQSGSSEIWNVRYATSNILSAAQGSSKARTPSVEVFAFGTAVIRG